MHLYMKHEPAESVVRARRESRAKRRAPGDDTAGSIVPE